MVFVKLTSPLSKIPFKNSINDAGFDITSIETKEIPVGTNTLISTGIHITDFPKDTYIRVAPRSGLAVKGIDVGAGVIDPSYTGEIKVVLFNLTHSPSYTVNVGDKIAQLIFEKYESSVVSFDQLDEESFKVKAEENTTRGEKGFGSSGV